MGGSPSQPCPSGGCLHLIGFHRSIQNAFKGDYKQIHSGFDYDLWGNEKLSQSICSTSSGGVRTCDERVEYNNIFNGWRDQVNNHEYIVTNAERTAAGRFSDFMISHRLTTTGEGEGACMVSSYYGAVCLLQNAADDGMETYRLTESEWDGFTNSNPTEAELSTAIKAGSGLQDLTSASVVEWMDAFHCEGDTGSYVCTAFQPDWKDVTGGYPRFGPEEADHYETSYVILTGASSTFNDRYWDIQFPEGAMALFASTITAATLFLTF